MKDSLHVLVLMGGPDAERPVSIQSGLAISNALRTHPDLEVSAKIIDLVDLDDLHGLPGDVVFPALHGPWGEGGGLQDLLEQLGRPYVGSGPDAARLAMDKIASKKAADDAGFQTPDSGNIGADNSCPIEAPLVIKPISEGSSIDVFICHDRDAAENALAELHGDTGRYMAETYIDGREITVGIINGRALPLIEIIPATNTYDYDAKYTRNDTSYIIDPELPPEIETQCRTCALQVFNRLGCRDIARVDFIVDHRGGWFLEINTMPGFTDHSLVPKAAAATGTTMSELCVELVGAAWARSHQTSPKHGLGA